MSTTAVPALRRIRIAKGFTSGRRFARALGVSHQTPFIWESGQHLPLPHHQQRLEDVLGEPMWKLFAPDAETDASEEASAVKS